jgi:hypothetical protein
MPKAVKSREGWELYTVIDGVMVGTLRPDHYAVCHNIQLPPFSAFHDIGHHLSMFIHGLPDDDILKCRNM